MEGSNSQPALTPQPGARLLAALPAGETLKIITAFIWRRLAFGFSVLLAIIYITYLGFSVVQGTDFLTAAGQGLQQTFRYLVRSLQGDLGVTLPGTILFRTEQVTAVVSNVILRSLGLLGATFLISVVIGVPLGALAAAYRRSKAALLVILASIVGISTPSFFAALFLQIAAIQYTRYVGHSLVPVGGFGWDKHLVLPVLVLAARPVAQITRITYVSLSEVFGQDYVRTAHSKGLRSDHIFFVHIVRNALVPILTTLAVSWRFSLSSLPVVEVYFGWGGIGETLLRAIFNQDADLSIAMFLSLGLLFILINLILELSYYVIDPRLQENGSATQNIERSSFSELLLSFWGGLRYWIVDNPVSRWARERLSREPQETSPYAGMLAEGSVASLEAAPSGDNTRWRAWRRGIFGNLPLMLGGLIVSGLVYLAIMGPHLAPYSPNTTQQIAVNDGVITTPPFPPSEKHVWGTDPLGRDMLSLILAGVQQTVILAVSVVVTRILIGFILGALAGWFHDSWFDRFLMALTQAIAVYPTLLLAALLIFIIGIEKGIQTFVIALSVVGWGEIMQFVRGEVINIRPKPFIESAVAIGQRTSRLILMHVLPNLAPQLVSVAALEVGAVLLILGELGFLGIFIRGGAGSDFGLFAQVPEWGGLLSGVRTWTRSYPWTGFFPTAAFFIAILGFNLFGEGIRRFLDEVGMVMRRLVNPYTISLAALAVVGFFWARNNTGELVFYRQQADSFDGVRALEHVKVLTAPQYQGRALGSAGLALAAEYIGTRFESLGLQPAGENFSYYQSATRSYQRIDGTPQFIIYDDNPAPEYLQDYAVYPSLYRNLGAGRGAVRALALGPQASFDGLDLSQDIVLLFSSAELAALRAHSCQGVLVVAEEQSVLSRRYTYSAQPPATGCGADTPVLYIRDRTANRLLSRIGLSVNRAKEQIANLRASARLDQPLGVEAAIQIDGEVRESPVVNVIGHLPGTSQDLDNHLIIVAAQYDSPPLGPEGVYPAANDNASGVAVMLEIIRTFRDSGYEPYKTFLFVAYSGEGLPDMSTAPEVERYLQAKQGFASAFQIDGVVYLRGMAVGQETLAIWSDGKTDLAKLLETASHLTGMDTERVGGAPDMNIFVPGANEKALTAKIDQVGISRQGWERSARLATDSVTFLRAPDLESAGRAITLGLMILGR